MKHLITLYLALFFMAGIQNTQAQTKEETIEWITEKLEKHGHQWEEHEDIVRVKKVTPCEIIYEIHRARAGYFTVSFDPSEYFWDEKLKADKKIIKMYFNDYKVPGTHNIIEGEYKTEYTYNIKGFYSVNNVPSDTKSRFAKALNHLATFCKEAF